MKKSIISCFATLLCATVASGQPAPTPAPEIEHKPHVVRKVVIDESPGPRLIKVQRGFFGISTLDMTTELLRHFGVDADGGVLISAVAEGGPADQGGVEIGDVLVEVDGEPIESRLDTAMIIGRLEPGSKVYAQVFRNRRPLTLEVTVGQNERSQMPLNWAVETHGGHPLPGVYEYRFKTGPDDEEVFVIDSEPMRRAVEHMHERVSSPEFQARIEAFRARNSELEVRLQEMERRLEEMGARLAEALALIRDRATDD